MKAMSSEPRTRSNEEATAAEAPQVIKTMTIKANSCFLKSPGLGRQPGMQNNTGLLMTPGHTYPGRTERPTVSPYHEDGGKGRFLLFI